MDPAEAGEEVMEDKPSIRDDSEGLVSEPHIEIYPVNLDNAPNPSPVQPTVVTTPSTSIFRFLSRPTSHDRAVPKAHYGKPVIIMS